MTEDQALATPEVKFTGIGIAAAISGIAAYGSAIGAVYMRSYWGSFGIDPFQYGSSTDIAIAGLSAVAAYAVLVLLAGWAGRLIAETASQFERGQKLLAKAMFVAVPAVVGSAIYFGHLWVLIALVGVFALTLMLIMTPTLPKSLRWPPTAALIAMLTIYLPLAAHGRAESKGKQAWDPSHGWVVDTERSSSGLGLTGRPKMAGRLGDLVVVLEPGTRSVILVHAGPELRIVTVPHDSSAIGQKPLPARPGAEVRPASPNEGS